MHRYLGNTFDTEDEVFLRFDLNNLADTHVIVIDHCSTTKDTKRDTNALLLTSDCINQIVVWAIDVNGKRVANPEEIEFFDKCEEEWWFGNSCERYLLTASIASIKVENVTGNMVEGFGRWFDNNRYRYYITFGASITS
jgi:hypothetical protein